MTTSHSRPVFAVFTLLGPVAIALAGSAGGGDGNDDFVAHQAIVQLVPRGDIDQLAADTGTTVVSSIPGERLYLLQLPLKMDEETFELLLEEDDRVEWAELNFEDEVPGGTTQSFFVGILPHVYANQYTWSRINLVPAHQISRGAGVVVAVLDTGVDSRHPAIAGRLLAGFNFVDGTSDVSDVGNGIDDDGDLLIDEMVGHGTFMTGIIARVAPDAMVLPIKVLDSDGASNAFFVAQGIYHAIEHGANVINLSLGSPNGSEIIATAIQKARDAGIVIVAAAGNENQQSPAFYPAADPNVIGVAATDANDLKAPFSNFGNYIALSAPGIEIASTFPNNSYAQASGTSAGTALVSGAAALLKAQNPKSTPTQIQAAISQSADNVDPLNPIYAGLLGDGRINITSAVGLPAGVVAGDLNMDAHVNIDDMLALINAWDQTGTSAADLNEDAVVGIDDLLIQLNNWH